MGYKVSPRFRESRLLAPSGRMARDHATYGPPYGPSLYCRRYTVQLSAKVGVLRIFESFKRPKMFSPSLLAGSLLQFHCSISDDKNIFIFLNNMYLLNFIKCICPAFGSH